MADRGLRISGGDRVSFVGTTGSGKTFAAGRITATIPRFVALNPKPSPAVRQWQYDGQWTPRNIKRLQRGENLRLHVGPSPDRDWEDVLHKCFEIGGLTIYIDELYLVNGAQSSPGYWLNACYTSGRELGIGVFSAMQRPSRIPIIALSESEWKFIFRLKFRDDKKRVAEEVGDEILGEIPDEFGFWLDYDRWRKPRYYGRMA